MPQRACVCGVDRRSVRVARRLGACVISTETASDLRSEAPGLATHLHGRQAVAFFRTAAMAALVVSRFAALVGRGLDRPIGRWVCGAAVLPTVQRKGPVVLVVGGGISGLQTVAVAHKSQRRRGVHCVDCPFLGGGRG